MTINNSTSLGAERFQREVALIMKVNIDGALTFVADSWTQLDQDYATAMGITYVALELEEIGSNIFTGDRPSLIDDDTPLTSYPNLSIIVDTITAAPTSIDQGSQYLNTLVIETIVKGDNEFDVDRRCKRTVDAINFVMQNNNTLNGLVFPLAQDPTIRWSNTFQRREKRGHGDKIWMKLGRLEYIIEKISPRPSNWMDELFSVDQQ